MIEQDITLYAGQDFGMTYVVPPGSDMERDADEGRKGKPRQSFRRQHPAAETTEILPLCRFADHAAVHRGRIMVGVENL